MKQFYKLSTFVMFLLISATMSIQAQNHENSLIEGARAFQFQINNNFTLSSFSGSAFSYKRHISEDRAHRISLSIQNSIINISEPNNPNERESLNIDSNVSTSFTWMNYINPENDIKFYYGYGPGLHFGYETSEDDYINQSITQTSISWGISGYGYSGVEWFFHQSISLHAEYTASIRADFRTKKDITEYKQSGDKNTDKFKANTFRLGGNGVRFGLSVYF